MKLVVGLGNPGRRYVATRHNAGVRVVEAFAARCGIALDAERFQGRFGRGALAREGAGGSAGEPLADPLEVGLLLPLTYMNRSGDAVRAALGVLPLASPSRDLLVVLDDVDLPLGRLRLRPGGGAGGHQGLHHVLERVGSPEVPRLRFGVGRPPPEQETADYVLEPFRRGEEQVLRHAIPRAADAVLAFLLEGVAPAMNRFNRDGEGGEPEGSPAGGHALG